MTGQMKAEAEAEINYIMLLFFFFHNMRMKGVLKDNVSSVNIQYYCRIIVNFHLNPFFYL